MARTIDPYDEEYEGIEPEPFVGAAPVAPVQTYTPDYTLELKPKGSSPQGLGLPLGRSVLDMRPSTYIGEGGGVGGRGGGRQDDPLAFDDFGREDPYGGGGVPRFPQLPQAIPTTEATLPSFPTPEIAAPEFPTATPTPMSVIPNQFDLGEFGGQYSQFDPMLSNFVNQFTPSLASGAFMEPAPDVTGQVQNLLTAGGGIPTTLQPLMQGLAGQPTQGQAPIQDQLSDYITSNIAGGADIPVQSAANRQIQEQMQSAGVSPAYVRAAKETIFDPFMEEYKGKVNQLGGGVADLAGGLPQELQRRQERDFMNNLIMAGQKNLPQYLQLGLAGGQQQAVQAADAARQAADREKLLSQVSTGGISRGIDFLDSMSQMRLAQQDQLGALIRAILSGATPRISSGVLASLVSGGLGALGPILTALGLGPKPAQTTINTSGGNEPQDTQTGPTKKPSQGNAGDGGGGIGGLLGNLGIQLPRVNIPGIPGGWGAAPLGDIIRPPGQDTGRLDPRGIGNIGGFGIPFF